MKLQSGEFVAMFPARNRGSNIITSPSTPTTVPPVTSVNFASKSVQLKMLLLSTSRDHIEINYTTIIEIVTRSSIGGVGATDRN